MMLQSVGSPIVTLFVESENTIASERRFDKGVTLSQLRGKLEPLSGIMAGDQKLLLYRDHDTKLPPLCELAGPDDTMLGAFPVENFMTLRVVSRNPAASAAVRNQYTDVSLVDKYEMPEDKYDALTDSVRDFKRRNKLGRFDDARSSNSSVHENEDAERVAAVAKAFPVGARCQADVGAEGDPVYRRGAVKFVGLTDFKPGVWVGVEYDEPVGKHDGSVGGKSYFAARSKHGAFLRPNRVEVGDFPEEDPFADDDLEEM
ncbi:hypothetical protein H9P43_004132 [Blastocladiella emersonii ATCC 22665]|nr:hypothetical protein H9P43_004132 [Blastocladiella emersonii ATCC 22665]